MHIRVFNDNLIHETGLDIIANSNVIPKNKLTDLARWFSSIGVISFFGVGKSIDIAI